MMFSLAISCIQFHRPWTSIMDNSLVRHTMEMIGRLVKDDVKLGSVYCTLILATPGPYMFSSSQVLTVLKYLNFVT